jgi:uncharacterized membrane protein
MKRRLLKSLAYGAFFVSPLIAFEALYPNSGYYYHIFLLIFIPLTIILGYYAAKQRFIRKRDISFFWLLDWVYLKHISGSV